MLPAKRLSPTCLEFIVILRLPFPRSTHPFFIRRLRYTPVGSQDEFMWRAVSSARLFVNDQFLEEVHTIGSLV